MGNSPDLYSNIVLEYIYSLGNLTIDPVLWVFQRK